VGEEKIAEFGARAALFALLEPRRGALANDGAPRGAVHRRLLVPVQGHPTVRDGETLHAVALGEQLVDGVGVVAAHALHFGPKWCPWDTRVDFSFSCHVVVFKKKVYIRQEPSYKRG
jgi:hypothetical protein